MRNSRPILAGFLLALSAFVPIASADPIYYLPLQYQYGPGPTFYYGGNDARVFSYAARRLHSADTVAPFSARLHTSAFDQGPFESRLPSVYSDSLPYTNAALFGVGSADARNQSNASAPTYFRKSDLLRSAEPAGDGHTLVVPPQAPFPRGTIEIFPAPRPAPTTAPTTRPATAPATLPLLIIPRQQLQPPTPSAASSPRPA